MPFLTTLFHRAERQLHRWAADPDTTESHQRNPMDRYEALLSRLMAMGHKAVARAAVRRQAHLVGCELNEVRFAACDKRTLAEECLDDLPSLAAYHAVLMDPESELYEVREQMAALVAEIRENYAKWCEENGVVP